MQGYFVKIGENNLGPFLTKAAAASEANALKEQGYTTKVVAKQVSETSMYEALGNPEAEVDLEDEDIDFEALFGEDENDEDGEDGDDGDDEDSTPKGEHGWFKTFGSKK